MKNKKESTRIHIERARHNLSQKKLAEKVGASSKTISDIELGINSNPSTELMLRIANFFKVSIEYLMRLNEKDNL